MNERLAKTDTIVAIYVLVAFIMLIVSLPAAILDVFMAFNIAIAFTILFACMFIKDSHECIFHQADSDYGDFRQCGNDVRKVCRRR